MLCVIIPTLNAQMHLEFILRDLGDVPRIVIADGGSEDKTLDIAARYQTVTALGATGRGQQLALGANWAGEADWYLFLHADSRLHPKAMEKIAHHMAHYGDQAGYFDFKLDSSKLSARFLEKLVALRCFALAMPYGDQGLLIPQSLYASIGGYDEITLFEDVGIIRRLGRRRLRRLGVSIFTCARRYYKEGYFRRAFKNIGLMIRYYRGADPEALAKIYYKGK